MFPNICFHKNANDIGCEVLYLPKTTIYCNGQTNPSQCSERQPYIRTHSRTREDIKHCDEDIISVVAVNSHSGTKELHPRSTCTVHRSHLIGRQPDKYRHVLTQRLHGGASCADQSVYLSCQDMKPRQQQTQLQQEQQQSQQHVIGQETLQQQSIGKQSMQQQRHKQRLEDPSRSEPPSRAPHSARGLQDVSADCFNIMYENVLKAVHGTVEHMLAKHFQCVVSRIQQMNAELIHQDHLLNQFKAEMLRKIHEHNEANLNQFKFISHLIVNNQKTNNCKQSQTNEDKEKTKAGTDVLPPPTFISSLSDDSRQQQQKQKKTEPETLKPRQEEEHKQNRKPIQHQLWQQQDLSPYPHSERKPSSDSPTSVSDLNKMTSSGNHKRNIQKAAKSTAESTQRCRRCALHAANETQGSASKRKRQCKSRPPAGLHSSTPVRNP